MRAEKSKNPSFEYPWRLPHFYDEGMIFKLLGIYKKRLFSWIVRYEIDDFWPNFFIENKDLVK